MTDRRTKRGSPSIADEAELWLDHVIEQEEKEIVASLNRILGDRLPLDCSMDRSVSALNQLRNEDPLVAELLDSLDGLIQLGGRYLLEAPPYRDEASYLE